MSTEPTEHSESVEISTNDDDGTTTSHTEVVEDGKTVVNETHEGDADVSVTS